MTQEGSLPRWVPWLPEAKRCKSSPRLHCHFTFSLRPSEIWLLFSKTIFTKICSDLSFYFFFFFSIHAIWPFVHIWLHNWCLSLQPQVGSPFLAGLKMYKMRPRAMKAGHLLQSQLDYGGSSLLSFTYFYFKYLQVLDSFSFKFVSIFYILKNAFWLRYSYHSFRFHIHLAYLAFLNRLEVGFNLTTSWLILLSIETSDQLFQFTSTILLCSIFWWRFFLAPFYFM